MPDAPETEHSQPSDAEKPLTASRRPRALQAAPTRRTLLLTALGGLLIGGIVTAVPAGGSWPGRLVSYLDASPAPSAGTKTNSAINRANSGDCLMWPDNKREGASIVDCKNDHRFEVAEAIDMRTFPGSEYGPNAAPPSAARIEQITQEQCEAAVRRYLGPRFDPDSKFSVSMLWSGDKAWRQGGGRRMLCGLQLPGAGDKQLPFKGKVADLDQSKVWPAGSCLGIDPTTNQPIDATVDCAAPHAMEVTGTVNLAEKFPTAVAPPEAEQEGFVKDACTRLTEAYLAPIKLRATTLTLTYSTLSLPSWSAGSHEVGCSIGATLGNGGWATLVNSAKGPLLINGQPPVPPPEIPEERLNPPAMPLPTRPPTAPPPSQVNTRPSVDQRPSNQHLPQQPAAPATQPPTPHQEAPPPGGAGAGSPPPPPPPPPPPTPPAPASPEPSPAPEAQQAPPPDQSAPGA